MPKKGDRVAFWYGNARSNVSDGSPREPDHVGRVRRVFKARKARNGDDVEALADVLFDGRPYGRQVPTYCLEVIPDA